MYEWLLILASHVNSGSVVSFERFATQQECQTAKQWFIDSNSKQGIVLERAGGYTSREPLQITCMKVQSLTK